MRSFFPLAIAFPLFLSTQNCADKSPAKENASGENMAGPASFVPVTLPQAFNTYWFAGQAELCSYDVVQERYGETRKAEQINVFVTEDFSRAKQVKLDDPAAAGTDREPVLKWNSIRRFHTGIYDYSVMQSVFTPLSGAATLKTSTTVQDWCGQVFSQCNLENGVYRRRSFSYFEKEGDQDLNYPVALLEDELWTRIRLDPESLPLGELDIIPSDVYIRLRHKESGPQKAVLSLEKGLKGNMLKLAYSNIPRTLNIRFEAAFPYVILGWEESYEGKLASKGELKAIRKSAYWTEHDNMHAPLRDSLQIHF